MIFKSLSRLNEDLTPDSGEVTSMIDYIENKINEAVEHALSLYN